LDEERQTNASLSAILEDLHSFEKPKEESSVLTPRMLTEIAELKDSISSLTEKGKDLEKDLAQANS
jgi:predicted transcriptional regulator